MTWLWCGRPGTYLRDLAIAGVPVVPTTFMTPDDEMRLLAGDGDFVVKPSVSAGSRDTARYTVSDMAAAQDHVQRLLDEGRTVLVQPYQHSVDIRGETALVFVNGRFSHAANKAAVLGADDQKADPQPATTLSTKLASV